MSRHFTRLSRHCEICQQSFFVQPSQIAKGVGRFCSHACRALFQQVSPTERFFQHLPKAVNCNGCLLWIGHATDRGYGMLKIHIGKTVRAHRFAYELVYGPFPSSLDVLHTCDNPPCVNPLHLFLGTTQDNSDDMVKKGRSLHGSRNPISKLTEENVVEILRRYRSGESSPSQLAKEFGVVYNCINLIVTRKSWKHLP